ncbi:MAG: hypothetical protein NZ750_03655 [Anaerolineae bacterium]|nr:hypothetical protein [Anaerolineae bacterium]MDW8171417.1 hypothetical protein [Anaerolineae bacterium]
MTTQTPSVRCTALLTWAGLCSLTGLLAVLYVSAGDGQGLLPLDDAYIHLQYARQAALGQFNVYNPGQPPTSGATSFLYPLLLALGHTLGWQGLSLGLWAILVGVGGLLASAWVVRCLALWWGAPAWVQSVAPFLFVLLGATSWHAFSGMETTLVMALTLWTLWAYAQERVASFALFGVLLALMRPEGGFLAASAGIALLLRLRGVGWRAQSLALLPLAALALQPLVNTALTGSWVASGNQAKSILASPYADPLDIASRIAENFLRTWAEFLSGEGRDGGQLPPLLLGVALVGWGSLWTRSQGRPVALLVLVWALLLSGAVATLDNAFWHFKRYQMPLVALFVPLVAFALADVPRYALRVGRHAARLYAAISLVACLLLTSQYLVFYAANVAYVRAQPYAMARWVAENTPEDSVVAVHDVGLIRYLGGRTTLDMVGLTTPQAAQYWRNGVGSVAELLLREQPNFIASYGQGHGYGLGLLANTALYAEPLAVFDVGQALPVYNVALAGPRQAIYRPDWSALAAQDRHEPRAALRWLSEQARIVDSLNVADWRDEQAHGYQWRRVDGSAGFLTLPRQLPLNNRPLLDGVRPVNGETFIMQARPGQEAALVTRLHADAPGDLLIQVNGEALETRILSGIGGQWLELTTLIPADRVTERLEVGLGGARYEAGWHWLIQTEDGSPLAPLPRASAELASFQDGALVLRGWASQRLADGLQVSLDWWSNGNAHGDVRGFIHLYPSAAQDKPPPVQWDGYLQGGAALGNLLPSAWSEVTELDIDSLPPGLYRLAIGFYDARSHKRLIANSHTLATSEDGRLFLGEVRIGR